MQPDTVWTWNAIGKRRGAWKLAANAPEATQGFLLNPLISDITPKGDYANADPVTGQAAWFDLRVRIEKASPPDQSQPQYASLSEREPPGDPLLYGAGFGGSGGSREASAAKGFAASAAPTRADET